MTYEEFKQNFLPEFIKIRSFAGKVKYASQYLTRIGSGSGRIVYDIDGEKVLKLAKNPKGIAQNDTEAGAGYYRDTQDIVTIVFDSAEDNNWLISEKAKKVNEKRIIQLTGIPSLTDLYSYLKNFYDENHGRRSFMHVEPEVVEQLNENEFAQELQNFIANYNQTPGDYGRPSSYGEVLRDGQPSIVLTDYGLNDEVYDTHYSPKKKQRYGMYEMYNFQDGNDDMLSDIGNVGQDQRHGMWALVPQGVGDGDQPMDEEFISYVEGRDKYPNKPISNLPFLTDRFHECVNNLRETLGVVKNKNKFYNNLLALQDYLTAQGFYDREPIQKEEYEINEADISQQTPHVRGNTLVDKNYATQIANAAAEKLNIQVHKYLGGGSNGFAFDIGDLKVFKISADISEGDAAYKLLRVRPHRIAIVYNLYKIVDSEKNLSFFGIIEQHIVDKPVEKFTHYVDAINIIMPNDMDVASFYIMMKRKFDYNKLVTLSDAILTANPESGVSEVDRQAAHQWINELFLIKKELVSYNIKSNDYSNLQNLGYDKGLLKFFDFGGYFGVEEPDMEDGNTIILPESVQPLKEDYDVNTADVIANKIAELKGFNAPQFMGKGMLGVAYDIGGDRVLKITKDNSEASENLMLIGKPLKYIAQPYNVFTVTSKIDNLPETFAIVLEKLKTDVDEFRRLFNRLDFAFGKILKVKVSDVIEFYLYGFRYDSDVDKNKVEKYFKTNPQDAEFFYSILRIAEECESYGIESKDYYNVENLGYKKTGVIGFFDVGFGNGFLQPRGAENLNINEDGTSKFSTPNSVGQDDFPPYVQNDTSPLADNNVPTDDEIHEDLEYRHASDATKDVYTIDERVKSFAPNSQSVEVKKKCRLGGNGGTSTACNQGDIDNLNLKTISETYMPNDTFWAWVSPDNQFYQVQRLNHKGFIMRYYKDKDFGWDYERVFEAAMKDGWVRVIFEKLDRDYRGELSLNGYTKDRVKQVFKTMFFDFVKYGNNIVYLDYEEPRGHEMLSTRDSSSKAKMVDYALNEVGEANVQPYPLAIERSDNMHKIYTFTTEDGDKYYVEFDSAGIEETNGLWATDFGVKNDNGKFNFSLVTNQGRVYRIMATLVKLMKGFLANTKPDTLVIEPTKTRNPNDRRRFHLYIQFIKKHLPAEYEFIEKDNEILIKKKQQLNEQSFKDFEKQIEKDNRTHNLDKLLLFEEDDYKVYAVNGDAVRRGGFDEWVDGGHHYVDLDLPKKDQKYAKFIPENEIWVDDVFLIKPDDLGAILLHETLERHLMKFYGLTYSNDKDGAHEIANKAEVEFRKKVKNDFGHSESLKIYNTFVEKYAEHHKEKKIKLDESIMGEAQLMSLQDLPFKQEVEQLGGKIFSVGGAVRDEFLGKESKDLDVLITGIPMDELEQLLAKYGRVDAVGKSFGVLKFKPRGATEDIDIAIPRTEKPSGEGGHKGFDVSSDHALPIEKDLERRDFTINAIAKDTEGNIVDPFGGQEDLKNKIIRIVNPEAFSDDPLRMLRAVQFASRFGFQIEPQTMQMIKDNASRIKEIPPERILTEFDKIVKKGNKSTGAFLLKATGLLKNIFGAEGGMIVGNSVWENIRTMGEFIYMLSHNLVEDPAEFYKTNLKGDLDTYKEIKALQMAFDSGEATNLIEARSIAHNMYVTSPQSLQSQIIPAVIKTAAQELFSGKYPKTIGELQVNGNDLIALGLKGKEIGEALKMMLLKIYSGKVSNNKEELLSLVQNKSGVDEYFSYGDTETSTWDINGEQVDIDFFIEKYDIWNQGGYADPTKESVLEFLQNNYEDLSHDEKLKKELLWALTDRNVLDESK